jgi:hypothetical protein
MPAQVNAAEEQPVLGGQDAPGPAVPLDFLAAVPEGFEEGLRRRAIDIPVQLDGGAVAVIAEMKVGFEGRIPGP